MPYKSLLKCGFIIIILVMMGKADDMQYYINSTSLAPIQNGTIDYPFLNFSQIIQNITSLENKLISSNITINIALNTGPYLFPNYVLLEGQFNQTLTFQSYIDNILFLDVEFSCNEFPTILMNESTLYLKSLGIIYFTSMNFMLMKNSTIRLYTNISNIKNSCFNYYDEMSTIEIISTLNSIQNNINITARTQEESELMTQKSRFVINTAGNFNFTNIIIEILSSATIYTFRGENNSNGFIENITMNGNRVTLEKGSPYIVISFLFQLSIINLYVQNIKIIKENIKNNIDLTRK